MKRKGHIYDGFVQSSFSQTNNAATMGEDSRLYSTEITINVLGYLVGDGENQDRPIARIDENVVEYQFPRETEAPSGLSTIFED